MRVLGPTILMVLALVLLLVPFGSSGRVERALMDLCHGPLFAAIASVFCSSVRRVDSVRIPVAQTIGIWILVAGLGGFTEVLQQLVGRQASWQDAWANVLGATAGVVWASRPLTGKSHGFNLREICCRILAVVLLVFAMAVPIGILVDAAHQHRRFPMLASFETPLELSRWSVQDARIQRIRRHETAGNWALRVDLDPSQYPGLTMPEVPPDWTPYGELVLEVTLETPSSLVLIVKLTDKTHNWETNDRFHHRAWLKRGHNCIRIPLNKVRHAPKDRLMDLSQMRMLQVFTVRPTKPARIFLDNIRLIPSHPGEETDVRDTNEPPDLRELD